MGLMDKAKEAAQQAKASAEKMAQQGQAKVAQVQHQRSEADLYRRLGEAYYAQMRSGGSMDAVNAALDALDAHKASGGSSSAPNSATDPGGSTNGGGPAAG